MTKKSVVNQYFVEYTFIGEFEKDVYFHPYEDTVTSKQILWHLYLAVK